jgi:RNA polymerase sigma-70 factor (sigma-E family)
MQVWGIHEVSDRMTVGLAFDDYIAAHGRALESYAYMLTGQAASAQDLVQTTLMKAYRHWRRVSGAEFPDAYVRRILTNTFLDHRRRRWSAEQPMADLPERAIGTDLAEGAAVRSELDWALQHLSPHQRAVIVLRHYVGLTDAAIAQELGCSQATVRSHVSRGLQRMRDVLGDQPTGPTDTPTRRMR